MIASIVAAVLLAGAPGPSVGELGWVLWVETTGIRTVIDAQKKERSLRDPIAWTVHDGYNMLTLTEN